MSMSKWTLYKLTRLTPPPYKLLNLYQQKWKSKSMMRHYHGEKVPEKQWERIFMRNKRLRAVVPMDPKYLAGNDGTEESKGRGAGLGEREEREKKGVRRTPYMNMTFSGLERRLDIAVFRALFASSARQARQFVVHGSVKVNGKTVSVAHFADIGWKG
jgi:ribosomal protein S4